MEWSPQQDRALQAIKRWLHGSDQQVFYLAGYAGTGKTTLASKIAESVDGTVLAAAYTGKAAKVLRDVGLPMASTIHRLIYTPLEQNKLKLHQFKEELGALLAMKKLTPEQERHTIKLQQQIKV